MKPSIPVLNGNFHAVQNRLVTYLQKLSIVSSCSGHERTGKQRKAAGGKISPLSAAISLTIIHSLPRKSGRRGLEVPDARFQIRLKQVVVFYRFPSATIMGKIPGQLTVTCKIICVDRLLKPCNVISLHPVCKPPGTSGENTWFPSIAKDTSGPMVARTSFTCSTS